MTVFPPVVRTVKDLRTEVSAWRAAGARIALVPTMGALHEGHLTLVRLARQHADKVVASLFVNPTQFAPTEDLATYPRQEETDVGLFGSAGCDLVYAPSVEEMYPPGATTRVSMDGPALGLESDARPHFFQGVATVVTKLFVQAAPDTAVFGEKDYQQLQVIKALVRDLGLPIRIVGAPTARDADGLALSSRNAYLSADELAVAKRLNAVLAAAGRRARAGEAAPAVEAHATTALYEAGFQGVDYVAVRRADLSTFETGLVEGEARILAAARIGRTRLIDNMAI